MSNNLFPSKKQKLSLLVLVNVPESRLRDEAWDRERERERGIYVMVSETNSLLLLSLVAKKPVEVCCTCVSFYYRGNG
jgi:hypothetical protein